MLPSGMIAATVGLLSAPGAVAGPTPRRGRWEWRTAPILRTSRDLPGQSSRCPVISAPPGEQGLPEQPGRGGRGDGSELPARGQVVERRSAGDPEHRLDPTPPQPGRDLLQSDETAGQVVVAVQEGGER